MSTKQLALLVSLLSFLVDAYSTSGVTQTTSQHNEIQHATWMFRGHPIAYEELGTGSGTPILLLNGFGMGSFHQHRLMQKLSETHTVYGIDYLGQGRSWPLDCQDGASDNEKNLQYSGSLWKDQIIDFIDQMVGERVHLVGNSVGGHLSAFIAAERPDLVDSCTLLNATPVWGLNLPGWTGQLPAPSFRQE